jgi:hypothetical protein
MGQGLHTKGCGLMDIHKVTIHVSCCPIIIIIVETCRLIADNTSKRTSQIILEQGNTFSITLKCIDANNDFVAIDNGRQFQVTALAEVSGLKKVKSTSVSVTHMLKENPTLSTQL